MNNKKIISLVVAGLLVVGVIGWFTPVLPKTGNLPGGIFGAAGNLLAENYIPYIMYNGGFNSAKDFAISGSSAFSGAVALTSTFKLGSSGTAQANQVITTCNPTANTSIGATSTGYIYCTGVTGITSSDYVFATFSTSTTAIADQWVIVGAKASTTAAAVDIKIMNLTGTAAIPSAASTVASSTRILGIH